MPLAGGSLSGLGLTPSFFGAAPMVRRTTDSTQTPPTIHTYPPVPTLDNDLWAEVIRVLQLSPQQVRVTARILRGLCDKQIASELQISEPTVRTHLGRIFQRNGLRDRGELTLRIFAIAQITWAERARHR